MTIEFELLARLAPGCGTACTAGNNTVVLFNVDGDLYALEGWCLRCGTCLAEGRLEGRIVACRGCDWRYDVISGSVVGISALRLQTFSARVFDGRVIVTAIAPARIPGHPL
jgi:nitrite reductase/ring-hydroxylating ferredoxin subunit